VEAPLARAQGNVGQYHGVAVVNARQRFGISFQQHFWRRGFPAIRLGRVSRQAAPCKDSGRRGHKFQMKEFR
jgi:hypothetical protein